LTWAFYVGAGDGNRTRVASLEVEAHLSSITRAFADLRRPGSVTVILRESQPVTDRSGTDLALPGPLGLEHRGTHPYCSSLSARRWGTFDTSMSGRVPQVCAGQMQLGDIRYMGDTPSWPSGMPDTRLWAPGPGQAMTPAALTPDQSG
jgi:hypothetical protein